MTQSKAFADYVSENAANEATSAAPGDFMGIEVAGVAKAITKENFLDTTGTVAAKVVSGTAGTDGNLSQWNADGDLVDGPDVPDNSDLGVSGAAVARRDNVKAYVDGFTSTAQTITSGGLLTVAHGLGAAPGTVQCWLVCVTGENGWTAGDRILANMNSSSSAISKFNQVYVDATNIYVRFSSDSECFSGANKTTGAGAQFVNANWELVVEARR